MKKYLIVLAAAVIALASCNKKEDTYTSISFKEANPFLFDLKVFILEPFLVSLSIPIIPLQKENVKAVPTTWDGCQDSETFSSTSL